MNRIENEKIIQTLKNLNPWWDNGDINKNFIKDFKRKAYYTLEDELKEKNGRIIILSGLRRVGKTTIVFQKIKSLLDEKKNPKSILFLSFDHPLLRLMNFEDILLVYKTYFYNKTDFYLFIDEIQYLENWESYLKMQYDYFPEEKIIATGSSSSSLEEKVRESGLGRWTVIKVPTLSFFEFCSLKGVKKKIDKINVFEIYKLEENEQNDLFLSLSDLDTYLIEYFEGGGFPEFIDSTNLSSSQFRIRDDIIDRALKRDLPYLYSIRSTFDLERIFLYIVMNSSSIISIENILKNTENVSRPTCEKYINYLEDGSLIYISERLNDNGKNILRKKNKIYVSDSSIRSSIIPESTSNSQELGFLAEGAAFKHIKDYLTLNRINKSVGYIRDESGAEVDIVIKSGKIFEEYIEVKARTDEKIKKNDGIFKYKIEGKPNIVITKNSLNYGREGNLFYFPLSSFLYLISYF